MHGDQSVRGSPLPRGSISGACVRLRTDDQPIVELSCWAMLALFANAARRVPSEIGPLAGFSADACAGYVQYVCIYGLYLCIIPSRCAIACYNRPSPCPGGAAAVLPPRAKPSRRGPARSRRARRPGVPGGRSSPSHPQPGHAIIMTIMNNVLRSRNNACEESTTGTIRVTLGLGKWGSRGLEAGRAWGVKPGPAVSAS